MSGRDKDVGARSLGDRDIRAALVAYLQSSDPTAAIFHELPLARGQSRADVACVNGVLAGYEIKSERDSLARLRTQIADYESVFEFVNIVVARCHLSHARCAVSRTWGIIVADPVGDGVTFRTVRKPKRNARLDRATLVRLLWKNECVRLIRSMGIEIRPTAPVIRMWKTLEATSTKSLCSSVRDLLKLRLSVQPQIQCDGSRPTEATA